MRQPGGGNQFRGLKTAGEAVDNLFLQEHEKHKKLEAQKKEYDAWIRDQEQEQCPRCDEPLMVNEGPSWKSFLHHGWNGIVTLHPCQECRGVVVLRHNVAPLLGHWTTDSESSACSAKCRNVARGCEDARAGRDDDHCQLCAHAKNGGFPRPREYGNGFQCVVPSTGFSELGFVASSDSSVADAHGPDFSANSPRCRCYRRSHDLSRRYD